LWEGPEKQSRVCHGNMILDFGTLRGDYIFRVPCRLAFYIPWSWVDGVLEFFPEFKGWLHGYQSSEYTGPPIPNFFASIYCGGIAGDQTGRLVGQMLVQTRMVKTPYGTWLFYVNEHRGDKAIVF